MDPSRPCQQRHIPRKHSPNPQRALQHLGKMRTAATKEI